MKYLRNYDSNSGFTQDYKTRSIDLPAVSYTKDIQKIIMVSEWIPNVLKYTQPINSASTITVNSVKLSSKTGETEGNFTLYDLITSINLDSSKFTSLDFSSFDTINVTNMNWMFSDCHALTSVNLSSFNTSNVSNMADMFSDCNALTSLDVSKFDTSKVTDMQYMFSGCNALTSLDLSNFDTSKVTDMHTMFAGCQKLTSLDLSKFDTTNVTDMTTIFNGCHALTSVNLSSFNTSNVRDMSDMFNGCSSLTSLDLSSFNTSHVYPMQNMFNGCSSLTSLDLSSFNTSNVSSMKNMFNGCSNLSEIKGTLNLINSLDTSEYDEYEDTDIITYNLENMFNKCSKLTSVTLQNIRGSLNLSSSPLLTHDCLVSIINALGTNNQVYLTLKLGSTNLAKLTAAEIKVGTDKHWTITA